MNSKSNPPRCGCPTNMHLTDQMLAEIETIQSRVNFITSQVTIPLEAEMLRRGIYLKKDDDIVRTTIEELTPFKVRLENLLCKTDCKEQVYSQKSEFIADDSPACKDFLHFHK